MENFELSDAGEIVPNEIEAIKAIYFDNILEETADSIKLLLCSSFDKATSQAWAEILLTFPPKYPSEPIHFSLGEVKNLSLAEIETISSKIATIVNLRSLQRCEMGHELLVIVENVVKEKEDQKNNIFSRAESFGQVSEKVYYGKFNKFELPNKEMEEIVDVDVEEIICESRFKNDFEVVDKLGKGGGGTVYKVRNRFDGMLYAVKKVGK